MSKVSTLKGMLECREEFVKIVFNAESYRMACRGYDDSTIVERVTARINYVHNSKHGIEHFYLMLCDTPMSPYSDY